MHHLPSFGVEEEFLLVDPKTGEPAPCNSEVAAEAKRRGTTLQLELSSCQVETTSGVAQNSMHIFGKAVDIRVPGYHLHHLYEAALSEMAGGVGYYPSSDFIHIDTGRIRHWQM